MADFCQEHCIKMFGEDTRDLAGLCEPDGIAFTLSECCGWIWVDSEGKRVYPDQEYYDRVNWEGWDGEE